MKSHLPIAITGLSLSALTLAAAEPQDIEINAIGSVAAGTYEASAAEIAAHDPETQRVFVVNAQLAQIDVVSIADPAHPRIIDTLDVKPFGKVANSVAVNKGLIAVAVESAVKTDPGKVVFFDNSLNLITSVDVGALPDMLTRVGDGGEESTQRKGHRVLQVARGHREDGDRHGDDGRPQGDAREQPLAIDLRQLVDPAVRAADGESRPARSIGRMHRRSVAQATGCCAGSRLTGRSRTRTWGPNMNKSDTLGSPVLVAG